MEEMTFGKKLNALKAFFQVTDKEIGNQVGAVASLVCRWRSGERRVDRYRDAHTVEGLALFFIEQAGLRGLRGQFAKLIGIAEDQLVPDNPQAVKALAAFLYDGKEIQLESVVEPEKAVVNNEPAVSCIGFQGVLEALDALADLLPEHGDAQLSVYLSLEYSRLLLEEGASGLWERLYAMNHEQPIRVVFDGWLTNSELVTQNLQALLPHMQHGRLQLHLIKSVEKFFYYNLTFFVRDIGMVITTEPVAGMGNHASLLLKTPDYVASMGRVFDSFDRKSKSLAKHFTGAQAKEEAVFYRQLFEETEDLQFLSDGVNLLYLDEKSYLELLSKNNISPSQRSYRYQKFVENKRRFDEFLKTRHLKEIISLPALDEMIAKACIKTADMPFFEGEIQADKSILKSLLQGICDYIDRYDNLTIYLERDSDICPAFTCKIKGDRFILLYLREAKENHIIYSDNWMLVYEYLKQFQESLKSTELINTEKAVKTALQIRLEGLGEL